VTGDIAVTITWNNGAQETVTCYDARAVNGVLHITHRMHSGKPDRHIPLTSIREYTTRET